MGKRQRKRARQEAAAQARQPASQPLAALSDLSTESHRTLTIIRDAGYPTVEAVLQAGRSVIAQIPGIGRQRLAHIDNQMRANHFGPRWFT